MPAMDEDDRPKKKIVHEIGQELALLSVKELQERIALLKEEIAPARGRDRRQAGLAQRRRPVLQEVVRRTAGTAPRASVNPGPVDSGHKMLKILRPC